MSILSLESSKNITGPKNHLGLAGDGSCCRLFDEHCDTEHGTSIVTVIAPYIAINLVPRM